MWFEHGKITGLCSCFLPGFGRQIWVLGLIATGGMGLISGRLYADSDFQKAEESSNSLQEPSIFNPEIGISEEDKRVKYLKIQSDRQRFLDEESLYIAEGNVKAFFNGGILRADRIEFNSALNTLFALGSVRFQSGAQYFQASSLNYSFEDKKGELKDVYGVLDLASVNTDFKLPLKSNSLKGLESQNEKSQSTLVSIDDGLACPPELPPIPDWHPHPWALTAWGGQMTDANFGKTFFFKGDLRNEYLAGISLQKRIYRAGPFALELEADLFSHEANEQAGGKYNQEVPFADTPAQDFAEAVLGIGARIWLRPWLSLAVLEGLSYNTKNSNYERTFRKKYTKLLNYLSFEVEGSINEKLSLVGRVHHRSGAFGFYNGTKEGSNAYLLGLRYRWGKDQSYKANIELNSPVGCTASDIYSDSDNIDIKYNTENNITKTEDKKNLESVLSEDRYSNLSLTSVEALRNKIISKIDQRVSNIQLRDKLTIERRFGVPSSMRNVNEKNKFGGTRVLQLYRAGRTKLLSGSISHWRVQAAKVFIEDGIWKADRMSFSNDPFTPSQSRVEAFDVVAKEDENGEIFIETSSNHLILEDRLPIPIFRKHRFKHEEEVENRWLVGIDIKDRDGVYIGRNLKPIQLGSDYEISLQPQLLIQRAYNNKTNSYVEPGQSTYSNKVSQTIEHGDLFGLKAEVQGKTWDWDVDLNADISTFNSKNLLEGSRYWGSAKKPLEIPFLGSVFTRLFGAYRYRTWNGSLGQTDIYTAYGTLLEKQGDWSWRKTTNNYLFRAGLGSYQAKKYRSNNLQDLWRVNLFGSVNSSYQIWRGITGSMSPNAAYRYNSKPVIPSLIWNSNINSSIASYGNGNSQKTVTFTSGPSLTLGSFSRSYLDYTKLSITGGATYKSGESPFAFDQVIDLRTIGIGFEQQIVGPIVLKSGLEFNIDPSSKYYGETVNSNIELSWQRRSYDASLYYNPYSGVGGVRFRLNDFNFGGTGVPFVPYSN